MSKLILGTVQFGLDYGINNSEGKPSFDEVIKILDGAAESGIEELDTAEVYGDAHRIIGAYHKISDNVFKIITKFNSNQTELPSSITERIEKHMDDLHIPSIEGFMYHSFNDYKDFFPQHQFDILHLKSIGKIKSIGVSLHSNEELLNVVENPDIDFIQLPFNLLDNSNQRREALIHAKKNGKKIHVRSVFLQGLFFKNPELLTGNLTMLKKYLKQIQKFTDASDYSIEEIAFNYAYHQQYIDKIAFGVQTLEQLNANLKMLTDNPNDFNGLFNKIETIHVEEVSLLNPASWQK